MPCDRGVSVCLYQGAWFAHIAVFVPSPGASILLRELSPPYPLILAFICSRKHSIPRGCPSCVSELPQHAAPLPLPPKQFSRRSWRRLPCV